MVPLSMTLSDLTFQGHDIFEVEYWENGAF